MSPPQTPAYAVLANYALDIPTQELKQRDLIIAQINLAQAAMAVEDYRCRFQSYPTSLQELEEPSERKIPKDPFTDKSFIYKRLRNGYILYSVGCDMKDSGGKTAEQIKHLTEHERGDIVWDCRR